MSFFIKYLEYIIKYRIIVLIFIVIGVSFIITKTNFSFIYSNEKDWILGSKEFKKTTKNLENHLFLRHLVVEIPNKIENFSSEDFEELLNIQEQFLEAENIATFQTIFNQFFIDENSDFEGSSFIEMSSLSNFDSEEIPFQIEKNSKVFKNFIYFDEVQKVTKLNFFVFMKSDLEPLEIKTDLKYTIFESIENTKHSLKDSTLLAILLIVLFILHMIAFKNLLSSFLGVIFIIVTSSTSIYLFNIFMNYYSPHTAVLILSIAVSLMDFIYIYYRWHVTQDKFDSKTAIFRTYKRTISPIFWTTVINVTGIGSLILVDSVILNSIGYMVSISSLVGLFFTITLLPILLSFFKVKNPNLTSKQVSKTFAEQESKYNSRILKFFLFLSFLVSILAIYEIYKNSYSFDSLNRSNSIKLLYDSSELNIETLKKLSEVEQLLQEFENIEKIESIFTHIKKIYLVENKIPDSESEKEKINFEDFDLERYIFMLDLFGGYENFTNNNKFTIDIILNNRAEKKTEIINKLRKWDKEQKIFIHDVDSLVQIAKIDSIQTIINLIIFIFLIIMTIVYQMTKRLRYSLMALYVNSVPLIWFFFGISILGINISIEVFVAMIVSLALSSDATMHFIHFYYRLDKREEINPKLSLEKLILYVGSPLILGNVILMITFTALIMTGISTIILIGIYASILLLMSIITDIFILPVMFLEYRKNN
jgi:predicted RND superfamily exporter protein